MNKLKLKGGETLNSYNLKGIQDKLNGIHPKQIVNRVGNLKFSMFEVKYEYLTNRNNKWQGEKVFLIDTYNPQIDLSVELNKWVEDYNKENVHRQISNVKFLDGQCIGYLNI